MMAIEGLSTAYGDKGAVDNVSVTEPRGAVTATSQRPRPRGCVRDNNPVVLPPHGGVGDGR